jgi:hypothetical protein
MTYSIKRHEVDRLCNVLVQLGWEIIDEKYGDKEVTLVIQRRFSDELLKASGELNLPSPPQ